MSLTTNIHEKQRQKTEFITQDEKSELKALKTLEEIDEIKKWKQQKENEENQEHKRKFLYYGLQERGRLNDGKLVEIDGQRVSVKYPEEIYSKK